MTYSTRDGMMEYPSCSARGLPNTQKGAYMSFCLSSLYDLEKSLGKEKGLERCISVNNLSLFTFSSFVNEPFDKALIQSKLKTAGSK